MQHHTEIKETVHTAVKCVWHKHVVPDYIKTLLLSSDSCSNAFRFWFDSVRWMNMVQSTRVHSCFLKVVFPSFIQLKQSSSLQWRVMAVTQQAATSAEENIFCSHNIFTFNEANQRSIYCLNVFINIRVHLMLSLSGEFEKKYSCVVIVVVCFSDLSFCFSTRRF